MELILAISIIVIVCVLSGGVGLYFLLKKDSNALLPRHRHPNNLRRKRKEEVASKEADNYLSSLVGD